MGLSRGLRVMGYAISTQDCMNTMPCHRLAGQGVPMSLAWNAKEALMTRIPIVVAAVMIALPAFALGPINQEQRINDTLRSGFIAEAISDTCPTMQPRKLRALTELLKLRDYALSQGYSAAEVRAFVESKSEKARGKAEATAWLATKAYCAVGEAEIAQGSFIGSLLRSTR